MTCTNSLIARRADPYIYKHTDGFYYFTASVPQHDRVVLRRATTLQGPGKRAGDDDLGASTPAGSSLPPTPGASDTRRTTCNHRKGV
ncbi:hypothetical protein ALI22I_06555 [Saccharothrix sp. ALI-22-I]|uniref:hypothetical protein n=1 Tax=Saccharothrix sp. ALI-22-I TaxID=1933778 RepID=UPI00097CA772|nr:hypothetical protein [Saccharothrix sp. ALI-22-I]ONI91920.1 hypothetical protein ALI22I_06555 [Saccharothrix sp. ALI-22-I]